MKSLLQVENFGATDADNDDWLLDCFEDHEAYQALLSRSKFLIVGRKGTGKTAIFKKLIVTRHSDYFCFGHTFSDYPWHYHDKQKRIGIPQQDSFTHSWKYLILLTLSKIVLNHDASIPWAEESLEYLERVERFVVDTYGTRDPDVTQVFQPTRQLRLKPSIEFDMGLLRAGVSPESVPMQDLPTIAAEVNKNLEEYVLASLNPDHSYFIAFDQLDLGFELTNPDYANRLIGLILACRDINTRARKMGRKCLVCMFIRDDIYDNLHFEDKNKITENFLSFIEWDTPNTSKTLRGLMERRFSTILSDHDPELVEWGQVFDEEKEMPGRQKKYQHVIDRTFLRPRDIIKFTNEVLASYKRKCGEVNNKNSTTFQNEHLHDAKQAYSNYFLKELDDEIRKHIPNYREYLDVFRSIGVVQFDRKVYIDAYNDRRKNTAGLDKDPIAVLKDLYEFSVVGFYRAGGRGFGGAEYIYRYKNPRIQFDSIAQNFRLHLGLMDVLGLKRFSKS